MNGELFWAAIHAQGVRMCAAGIGTFDGLQRQRQARVELVGGGADGTMLAIGHHAPLKDRFVATGAYDDGSGVERVEYVRRSRSLHPEAVPVIDYVFAGLP